ncbi:hypothetical protein [Streptomyces avicenniae]|uniref:hypothetical protein n=1 Tax=Streptomyces avicenniae TaxID=500153 RepID=UPI00069AB09F|nr:hypothetical protein [Streptomyces avicenniae]
MVNVKKKRNARRVAAVTAGTALFMLLSSPSALALYPDDGDDPGSGLSVIQTLSMFVVAPIVLFVVIAGLVVVAERKR